MTLVSAWSTTAAIGDSVQRVGGGGVSAVVVDLFFAENTGTHGSNIYRRGAYLRSTSTNTSGVYRFSVTPRCYFVVFVAPAGSTFTTGTGFNEQLVCVAGGQTDNTIDAMMQ